MLALQRVFHFTEADLAANRRGEVGQDQRAYLRQTYHDMMKNHRQSTLGIVALLGVGAVCGFLTTNADLQRLGALGLMLIPMMLLIGGGSYLMQSVMYRRSFYAPRLFAAEGTARLEKTMYSGGRGGSRSVYILHLDRQKFYLHPDQFFELTEGTAYRVYFIETYIHMIIALEMI